LDKCALGKWEGRIPTCMAGYLVCNEEKCPNFTQEVKTKLNDGWISVNDRLPHQNIPVLTCTEFGEIAIEHYCEALKGFTDKTFPTKENISSYVVAWQKLPEKYIERN